MYVDETYQGKLALLLALDLAAPSRDRLVGYQSMEATVKQEAVPASLTCLKEAGICPEEVITDGSTGYPAMLAALTAERNAALAAI